MNWRFEKRLARIESKLDAIMRAQNLEIEMEFSNMKTTAELIDAIEEQTSVVDGVATLVDELQDAVKNAAGDQAKIDAAFEKIKANTKKISDAMVENTDAGGGSVGGNLEDN